MWLALPAFLLSLFVFGSCSHLTVAPKPVEAHVVALGSTNQQDADVVDGDAKGLIVRQAWVDSYFALESKFKENIPADKLIKGIDSQLSTLNSQPLYRVPYPCSDHMASLKARARLAEAGP